MPAVENVEVLLNRAGLGSGNWCKMRSLDGWVRMFQVTLRGTGAISATVKLFGRMDDSAVGALVASFTLSDTSEVCEGVVTEALWPEMRAEVTAITGSGANVTVTVGGPSSLENQKRTPGR